MSCLGLCVHSLRSFHPPTQPTHPPTHLPCILVVRPPIQKVKLGGGEEEEETDRLEENGLLDSVGQPLYDPTCRVGGWVGGWVGDQSSPPPPNHYSCALTPLAASPRRNPPTHPPTLPTCPDTPVAVCGDAKLLYSHFSTDAFDQGNHLLL